MKNVAHKESVTHKSRQLIGKGKDTMRCEHRNYSNNKKTYMKTYMCKNIHEQN